MDVVVVVTSGLLCMFVCLCVVLDLTKLVRRNLVGEPQGSASLQLPSYGRERGSAVFKVSQI